MLINLSNHPYSAWDEAQRLAAQSFGTCIDIPFPQIAADADESAIQVLADQYLQAILTRGEGQQVTVHLMGEMCFTFALVSRLLHRGIPCIAACAARNVTVSPDGVKSVIFNFTRFRHYEF
jgi:hypothetical protein